MRGALPVHLGPSGRGPSRLVGVAALVGPLRRLRSLGVLGVLGALAVLGVVAVAAAGCEPKTEVSLWVDGFLPQNVRFEIEDQGPLDAAALAALVARPDVDGSLLLPAGSCGGPCRVALVSVFVHNKDEAQAPPVVRLQSPPGRPARLPIAFRGAEISKGRIGRIRWVVEMWPEEQTLTATLSSSVFLVEPPAAAAPPAKSTAPSAPSAPAPSPPPTAPSTQGDP